ncbi:polysaccharide biosynthesis protein [Clostridium sp. DL-VIII]|uniref:lipopolysaccharide biosynthesis protein n=1 Tax=Clostridium sp. DL-VIII TaxID=641107 RepID=UPI00023AF945|nr:oligosaccharide flippase family protein [Clostridium sp. DL-VIII]EHI99331.1 polysaccharide biosynthesis protein [Clostridium sp. DL-VIII]
MNINKLRKDFFWYFIGAVIPIILNFIKMPIFTRYFSPADYGYLTLINTTYSYISLFTFSWIISCVYRYYIHEKNNKDLKKFYTNIIFLLFIGIIASSIFTIIWILINDNELIKELIIANYINLIFGSITSIYLVTIRLDGRSFICNVYTTLISITSFAILFILTFAFNNSISAILNCNNIVNIVFVIFIIYKFRKDYKISKTYISKELIIKLLKYGFATVFFNMSLLILTSGDRYVIKIFYSVDKVGIYNQIYNLSQISIAAIVNIFFNIINQYEFKLYEEDAYNEEEFYSLVALYIICIAPITIYFSLYAKDIANLLLGEKFAIGYKMMPYIMVTTFLYGIAGMHQERMKFKNKLKNISINLISASILNLILNFIFVPIKGYEIAAVTTLISYIYLYVMNIKHDISNINNVLNALKKKINLMTSFFLILLVQVILHFLVKFYFGCSSIAFSIIEGSIFFMTLYVYMYLKNVYSLQK